MVATLVMGISVFTSPANNQRVNITFQNNSGCMLTVIVVSVVFVKALVDVPPGIRGRGDCLGVVVYSDWVPPMHEGLCMYSGTPLIRTPLLQYFDTFCCPK